LCQTGEIFIGTDNRNRFGKILFATYADDLTFMVKERIGVNEKKKKNWTNKKVKKEDGKCVNFQKIIDSLNKKKMLDTLTKCLTNSDTD
jgi:hypothetical protein